MKNTESVRTQRAKLFRKLWKASGKNISIDEILVEFNKVVISNRVILMDLFLKTLQTDFCSKPLQQIKVEMSIG